MLLCGDCAPNKWMFTQSWTAVFIYTERTVY
jgi:hypothetical protein